MHKHIPACQKRESVPFAHLQKGRSGPVLDVNPAVHQLQSCSNLILRRVGYNRYTLD